jgi:hypothetical protein
MFTEAYCQRFFIQGCQSSFFTVHVIPEFQNANKKPSGQKNDLLRTILNEQLHVNELEQQVITQTYSSSVTKTEVSPWLEMTRRPRYFSGLDMTQIAPLGYAANPVTEAALVIVGDRLDRIIERAYRSICEDRTTVFDQAKINSFIADRLAKQERMIMIKL